MKRPKKSAKTDTVLKVVLISRKRPLSVLSVKDNLEVIVHR